MITGTGHWVKIATDNAKRKAGPAWTNGLLSAEMKRALLSRELVYLMLGVYGQSQETDLYNTFRKTLSQIED